MKYNKEVKQWVTISMIGLLLVFLSLYWWLIKVFQINELNVEYGSSEFENNLLIALTLTLVSYLYNHFLIKQIRKQFGKK